MDLPDPKSSAAQGGAVTLDELMVHSSWVRALARTLVKDPSTAEDLVQETWLAALKRPPRGGRPLRPWLAQVLRNFARMHRRSEGSRTRRQTATAKDEALPASDELVQRLETQRGLAEHVLALEEPDRSTVILRYYEGLSAAEIARRQGEPAGTVRWRLSRAHGELRQRLDREHGDRRTWCLMFAPLSSGRGLPWAPGATPGVGSLWIPWIGALALILVGVLGLGFGWPTWGTSPAIPERVAGLSPEPAVARGSGVPRGGVVPVESTIDPAMGASVPPMARVRVRAVDSEGRGIPGAWVSGSSPPKVPGVGEPLGPRSGPGGWVEELWPIGPAVMDGGTRTLTLHAPGYLEKRIPWHPSMLEGSGDSASGKSAIGESGSAESASAESGFEGSGTAELGERAGTPFAGARVLDLGEQGLVGVARLEGRVLDRLGQPCSGLEVGIEFLPGRWAGMRRTRLGEARYNGGLLPADAPRTETDHDGRFRFEAVEPGYGRVWVVGRGEPALDHGPLALRAGDQHDVGELRLPGVSEGERLVGRVLDRVGRGVPFAEVEWSRPSAGVDFFDTGDGQRREGATRVLCDEHGNFEGIVDPKAALELVARDAEGLRSSGLVHLGRSAGLLRRCDLTLDRGARVEVRFESSGEDGIPALGGAFVLARGPRIGNSGGAVTRWVPELDPLAATETLVFSLPRPLRPTTLELRIAGGCQWNFDLPSSRARRGSSSPEGRAPTWRFPLTADACRGVEVLEGTLERADGGAWSQDRAWSVEVLAAAIASRTGGVPPTAGFRSDVGAQGRFELVRPDPGPCWIRVLGDGEVVARARWPEDGELRLVVGDAARLGGAGIGLPEGPDGPRWVGLQGVGGRVHSTPLDADGRYRFEDLVPGSYRLGWLDSEGVVGASPGPLDRGETLLPWMPGQPKVRLELAAGADGRQDLEWAVTSDLELRLGVDGATLGPWQVRLTGPPGSEPRRATVLDPTGRARFRGLEGGAWVAEIWPCEESDSGVSLLWDLDLDGGTQVRSLDLETTVLRLVDGGATGETETEAAPASGWPACVLEVEVREDFRWIAEVPARGETDLEWERVPAGILRIRPDGRDAAGSRGSPISLSPGGTTRVDAGWLRRP